MLERRLRLLSQLRGPCVWTLKFPLNLPATEGAAVTCLRAVIFRETRCFIQEPFFAVLAVSWASVTIEVQFRVSRVPLEHSDQASLEGPSRGLKPCALLALSLTRPPQ